MANQTALRQQLAERESQLEVIAHKISTIILKISKLSRKFFIEADRIQQRINKVQASRPRGNPATQWPHRPISSAISAFLHQKRIKMFEFTIKILKV